MSNDAISQWSGSGNLTVAAIQMVSSTSVTANLSAAERLIAEAADAGARLIVLPEYFCLMGKRDTDKVSIGENEGSGAIQDFLRRTAIRHQIVLVGGTLPLKSSEPGKVRNTTMVYDAAGEVLARYDKIHLFGFRDRDGGEDFDEARTISPGDETVCFDARFDSPSLGTAPGSLQVGLSICYDLRFPELFRRLSDGGKTTLMLVPSAFTHVTGKAHWEILLRARAIENQCYILAAAQGGRHENGRRTWGHSMLIGPWGEIKAELAEGEGVVLGEIDPTLIDKLRGNLPALKHRVL